MMNYAVALSLAVAMVWVTKSVSSKSGLLVCYIDERYTLALNSLDPRLCTHLILLGYTVWPNATFTLPDPTIIHRALLLKKRNQNLKVMISLVGGKEKALNLSILAQNEEKCRSLAQFSLEYIKWMNLDGIDIDWEYPGYDKRYKDKVGFITLLKNLYVYLKKDGRNHSLSVALRENKERNKIGLDFPKINKYVDFVNLMNYNFHTCCWSYGTGYNSPLTSTSWETGPFEKYNINNFAYASTQWMHKAIPKYKIALGIPFYGYGYTLENKSCHHPYCPVKNQVNLKLNRKLWFYAQVQNAIKKGDLKGYWDEEAKVPYAYKDEQWVSYENKKSVALKAKWAKDNGFGVMIWEIHEDDWKGEETTYIFPLLKAINNIWYKDQK